MRIFVNTSINALHRWDGAKGRREYLSHPHLHKFNIQAWAKVSHSDRDIEFHDLRDMVDEALIDIATDRDGVLDFGGASCEDIGNMLLDRVPELDEVLVMEDDECGAKVSRPTDIPIETICGSTRFKQAWLDAMKQLEIEGVATFQVGSFMHADDEDISEEQKEFFDYLHKRKIDISDGIYVLNVDGYIGESTASEIRYARRLGKYVRFLEPDNVPEEFR